MNTDETIEYINTHFDNIVNNKIKGFEQSAIKIITLKKHMN